jgi:ubiquinone/menaquinone biosynthesis C-methylase UbiE
VRIAEIAGPSGAGKSTIYSYLESYGGFVPNPQISGKEAADIVNQLQGADPRLDDFLALIDYMARMIEGGDTRHKSRITAIIRAIAKIAIARSNPDDPRWMIVDGGLIHRGQSVDLLIPKMPLRRYFELMPTPDLVLSVRCRQDELIRRNRNRNDTDRSGDLDRAIACHDLGLQVLESRRVAILDVDSTTLEPDKAARICLHRLGIIRKYADKDAELYDERRTSSPKWKVEQHVIQDMLGGLSARSVILDAPIGTGRFLDFYQERGFIVRGLDISADMIAQAARKVKTPTAMIDGRAQFQFIHGDVRNTGLPNKSVDATVNCRVTRWLSIADCQAMLREMQRIAKSRIIWTARVANHPFARPLEIFTDVLDGWHITRNEAGADPDYRIIMAEPQ